MPTFFPFFSPFRVNFGAFRETTSERFCATKHVNFRNSIAQSGLALTRNNPARKHDGDTRIIQTTNAILESPSQAIRKSAGRTPTQTRPRPCRHVCEQVPPSVRRRRARRGWQRSEIRRNDLFASRDLLSRPIWPGGGQSPLARIHGLRSPAKLGHCCKCAGLKSTKTSSFDPAALSVITPSYRPLQSSLIGPRLRPTVREGAGAKPER